jgi:hypothetical protein
MPSLQCLWRRHKKWKLDLAIGFTLSPYVSQKYIPQSEEFIDNKNIVISRCALGSCHACLPLVPALMVWQNISSPLFICYRILYSHWPSFVRSWLFNWLIWYSRSWRGRKILYVTWLGFEAPVETPDVTVMVPGKERLALWISAQWERRVVSHGASSDCIYIPLRSNPVQIAFALTNVNCRCVS